MNRRERVLAGIHHQETDFVPYNFHAVSGVWEKVLRRYGLKDNHQAMEFIGNHIVKVGSDFNYNPWADEVGKVELTLSGGPVHTDVDQAGELWPRSTDQLSFCKPWTPTPSPIPIEKVALIRLVN
jgi:hypothetical protein